MRLKAITDEDFVNYKKPSMFLGTCFCDWKCCNDLGINHSICQNHQLSDSPIVDMPSTVLYGRYIHNPITKAIVIGGLEPMIQLDEVIDLIRTFRYSMCFDDFVIYTGYNKDEIIDHIGRLNKYSNVIVKFGRYIPDQDPHMDKVLGVELISDNQYAEKIS